MTNKVKPFFIRITDDMTPQMVQDAFDKCVDAGVSANDCIENATMKNCGWCYSGYIHDWKVFGVIESKGTWLGDDPRFMYSNAQEITLDQLDEWLGLEVEAEPGWKNGDECIYQGKPWHFVSILSDEFHGTAVIFERISEKLKQVDLSKLEKPETPEQKAERERLEFIDSMFVELNPRDVKELYDGHRNSSAWKLCAKAYDAGYRKQ